MSKKIQLLRWGMDENFNQGTQVTLDDLQRVAPLVLEKFQNLAKMPHYGTVAGQAVASLMWEALDLPMRGPINDIDVFVNKGLPRSMRGLDEINENDTPEEKFIAPDGEDGNHYNHITKITMRCNTKIVSTYRTVLLNYTLISAALISDGQFGHDETVSRSLIEGFDLNLVGVGINLETGQVVATDSFIEFLNTRTIQTQTCIAPAHTLIRLADKVFGGQLTGVSCDYDNERLLLESAILCQSARQAQENTQDMEATSLNFGLRYVERHKRLASHLPAIKQTSTYGDKKPLYSFIPRLDSKLSCAPLFDMSSSWKASSIAAKLALIDYFPQLWRKLQEENINPTKSKITTYAISQMFSDKTKDPIFELMEAIDLDKPYMDIISMDIDEQSYFFLGQTCSLKKELMEEVVAVWDGETILVKHLLRRHQIQADELLAIGRDHNYWKEILLREGNEIIQSLSECVKASENTDVLQTLEKILHHLTQMGKEGDVIIQSFVNEKSHLNRKLFAAFGNFSTAFRELPDIGQPIANQLLTRGFPGWPTTPKGDIYSQSEPLRYCALAGLNIPSDYIENLSNEAVGQGIIALTQATSEKGMKANGQLSRAMRLLFERLSDEELMRDQYKIARAVLDGAASEALVNHLIERSRETQDAKHIHQVISIMDKTITHGRVTDGETMGADYWETITKEREYAMNSLRLAGLMMEVEIIKSKHHGSEQAFKTRSPKM